MRIEDGIDGGAVTGPEWAMLPRPNKRLSALAREAARCAQRLLPPDAGLILGLEMSAHGVLRLLWWRREDFRLVAEIAAAPEGYCPPESDEGVLQDVSAALLTYLAGRWPTPPSGLGVITDGVGVAFTPTDPAPSANGWLMRCAMGQSQLTMILPLDPLGPCALLCGTRDKKAVLH